MQAQLTEAESELAAARAAAAAREAALRAARTSLRQVHVEAAGRAAALQASLADALGQVNTLTQQVGVWACGRGGLQGLEQRSVAN